MSRFRVPRLQTLWRLTFIVAIVTVGVLALSPKPLRLPVPASDKLQHGLAFAVLATLLGLAWPSRLTFWLGAVGLVAYGAAIEVAQQHIPGRYGELLDLAADSVGIIVGLALITIGSKRFPKIFRWLRQGRG